MYWLNLNRNERITIQCINDPVPIVRITFLQADLTQNYESYLNFDTRNFVHEPYGVLHTTIGRQIQAFIDSSRNEFAEIQKQKEIKGVER